MIVVIAIGLSRLLSQTQAQEWWCWQPRRLIDLRLIIVVYNDNEYLIDRSVCFQRGPIANLSTQPNLPPSLPYHAQEK